MVSKWIMMASFLHPAFRFDDPSESWETIQTYYGNKPQTASETCFQGENIVYAYFMVKKFQKNSLCILVYTFQVEKISLKFDNSANHAKS